MRLATDPIHGAPLCGELHRPHQCRFGGPHHERGLGQIEAELERDNIATYELIFGETRVDTSSDFERTASPVGKGYRQEHEDKNGNPYARLVVVLPPVSGESRQTIVQTSGDPGRAQSLMNGTKLR